MCSGCRSPGTMSRNKHRWSERWSGVRSKTADAMELAFAVCWTAASTWG